MEGSGDFPGLTARQEVEIAINALRAEASEFDETELIKQSAFLGYQPNVDWLPGRLQAMFPGYDLPEFQEGESATEYVDRVTVLLINGMEE